MKPDQRARLTSALRDQVARIAADLRVKLLAPGPARARAEQLRADERVGEGYEVWTDLLSRRAAVLWVLKSVYVRVLEDRGLLAPGRLLDPEAQQLFEKLAPNLGETAFLRWIYRDLAQPAGGLPELFGVQPAELVLPSDELSRALIQFWRHRDADTGATWSFAQETFEGELMGDLYQELDPVVKDRFALCQTPDFVRAFLLDRTLTPAIEHFGADRVRLLDPACGSGHFLIDGLKRLVAATAAQHPDWRPLATVRHALNRVVGLDLNDYACGLARARLLMTAAELAGLRSLDEAGQLAPHVYWADGLEQVEREEGPKAVQIGLFSPEADRRPRATFTRSDVRAALQKLFAGRFHAVVANPPYITEKDPARKDYHRELIGKDRRYVSANGKYSLGAPFTERCFQLAEKDGFVGIITSNNFMKREFGKALIERVLSGLDLTLVVDTSQAYIPHHGTPTVLLFGRNRRPVAPTVRAVMGKRGESGTPADPAYGKVWTSIEAGWSTDGFETEYVSVAEVARETLARHPWSLGGGGASELRAALEARAQALGSIAASIGYTTICGEDPVFIGTFAEHQRRRVASISVPLVAGDSVRDWSIEAGVYAAFPYSSLTGPSLPSESWPVQQAFWRYRQLLRSRAIFQQTLEEKGMAWFEHMYRDTGKLRTPLSIAFAFVATHNHFVLDRGGKVFKQSAPVIKLPPDATEDDHFALLGLLNSSTLAFWMRQVFFVKGGESTGKKRQAEVWSRRLEYDSTKLSLAPIVDKLRDRIVRLAAQLDDLASQYAALSPKQILATPWGGSPLAASLSAAAVDRQHLRARQVALQEELDWTVYVAYGLVDERAADLTTTPEPLRTEHRPFAIQLARAAQEGQASRWWFEAMGVAPSVDVPASYAEATRRRLEARLELLTRDPSLALIEVPEHKRKWETEPWESQVLDALAEWMADRIEQALAKRSSLTAMARLVSAVQDDQELLEAATLYSGRADVDISTVVEEFLAGGSVPSHRLHVYTESGLKKREAWEQTWALQRREDAGENVGPIPVPPEYSQGSRGKSTDFLRPEYWQLRGKLDVPKERFVAFTEVPGRTGEATLYGWAGWTPLVRLKALLAVDEDLDDEGLPLADRIGLLDSAWRLLPDVAREDPAVAARLKAELQALVGPTGPSPEQLADWRARSPPPKARPARTRRARPAAEEVDEP